MALKRYLFIATILLFFLVISNCFAIAIIEPVAVNIENNQEVIIGNAAPGQSIRFVIARIADDTEFNSIEVANIPEQWHYAIEKTPEFFAITITIPKGADTRMQRIAITLKAEQPLKEEKGYIIINVRKGLLEFVARELLKETEVNKEACFKFTAINNSIADERLGFYANLPKNWIKELNAIAKKNSATDFSICIIPRASGVTRFKATIKGENSNESKEFELLVKARPRFVAKAIMPVYAMPLMLPSIMQSYLVNALLGFFIK